VAVPSVATIWRVRSRRGFIIRQPHKRARSSWRRFQAELPNECCLADTTHWALVDGTDVEILNMLDDHSRLLVASRAFATTKAADAVESFHHGANQFGSPASLLTDDAAVFTAEPRHGTCAIELELIGLGIASTHSRPYHPQTCGKVERFHQTLMKWLTRQPPAATLAELQTQLDWFRRSYNTIRPHRALGRRRPLTPTHNRALPSTDIARSRRKCSGRARSHACNYRAARDRLRIARTQDSAGSESSGRPGGVWHRRPVVNLLERHANVDAACLVRESAQIAGPVEASG
jgi:transposase InsO family protein